MSQPTFKAMVVRETGDKKFVREIATRRIEELAPGEVLIKVSYSSLNYKDALSATGHRGVTRKYPHTPGIEPPPHKLGETQLPQDNVPPHPSESEPQFFPRAAQVVGVHTPHTLAVPAPPQVSGEEQNYSVYRVRLQLEGRMSEMLQFLAELVRTKRLYLVETLRVVPHPEDVNKIKAQVGVARLVFQKQVS